MSKAIIENWRLKAKKELANSQAKLKAIHALKKEELNRLANTTDRETFEELDCLDCANCCKNLPAAVNNADIQRIAKHLNINQSDFRRKYLVKDEDGDWVTQSKPCPFLNLQDNRCKIYEVRPQSCKDYPITGNDLFVNNKNLHLTNSIHCPAVFEMIHRMHAALDNF